MKKFFDYIQLANFDIAADAAATFKVLKNILTFSLVSFPAATIKCPTCNDNSNSHCNMFFLTGAAY